MSNSNTNILKNKNVKKYTVAEFCKKYTETNVAQTKDALIQNIMNPQYVPYEMKITICEKIIENSYYKTIDREGVKTRKLHINSPVQYMLYCLWMVKQYTYIEVDFSKSLEEFNLLNKFDILDFIYSRISEKELKEFQMILEMIEGDVMQNEYEPHAFISNQVERFGELFSAFANPALLKFVDILENVDEEKMNKIVDRVQNFSEVAKKLHIV